MTGWEFPLLAMPVIGWSSEGFPFWLHGRADDASRGAEAEFERSKG